MYRVSYINNKDNSLGHKGGFDNTKAAETWVKEQGDKITALKLLVWSDDIDCFQTVKEF